MPFGKPNVLNDSSGRINWKKIAKYHRGFQALLLAQQHAWLEKP